VTELQDAGWRVKKSILEISKSKNTPHVSSSLSVSDILVALFFPRVKSPRREVYLSKGHAALALYATLREFDYISEEDLSCYSENGSIYEGHVNSKIPGVPLSTGSLGHALAFACGRALADSLVASEVQHWVVLSDGELDEGSNWESLLLVAHLGLSNLNVIIDRNGLQSLKETEKTLRLEPLAEKLSAFNWRVREANGHDLSKLRLELDAASDNIQPTCIIANTAKGYPLADMMDEGVRFHYKPATEDHIQRFDKMHPYEV
jgi:transketolase